MGSSLRHPKKKKKTFKQAEYLQTGGHFLSFGLRRPRKLENAKFA